MSKRNIISAVLFVFLLGYFPNLWAQAQEPPLSKNDNIVKDPDIVPMYTGGSGEMHKFIKNNLKYPPDAALRNAQGLVVYTFVVEKDGSLSNFKIIHRADSLLDLEALRILNAMPPWRPARYKGEIVRAETYVPMLFRLNKNARKTPPPAAKPVAKEDTTLTVNEDVLSIVDQMPQFEGGEDALRTFISNTMKYPSDAYDQGIAGRVLCSFVVAKDGTISNIEVVESLHPSLDQEAVRMLSVMPKWIPGKDKGVNVNVKCLLPIDFSIQEVPATSAPTL